MGQWSHLYNNRAWRRLRRSQLQREPLCERCKVRGVVTDATVCDHIESHHGNLERFWAGPLQSLCATCHSIKTITEDAGLNSGATTHPEWLPTPACSVVLVTGPPGAGKTTWCRQQREPADTVIDLDECFFEVCGAHGHEADRSHLKTALRLRNKLLAGLATKRSGTAYVIVGAPSRQEVEWWQGKLGATHKAIEADRATCLARVKPQRRQAVVRWFDDHEANRWRRPQRRVEIGLDGWPVDRGGGSDLCSG